MNERFASQIELWQQLPQRLRPHLRSTTIFAGGIAAALVALLLYNVLVPASPSLTTHEVSDSIAQAIASVTPPPAYSAQVYRAIFPSLVLIQTETSNEDDENSFGVGSGVVINENGDILTSLHVVANATDIQITYTDGSQTNAQVVVRQPESDIAVLQAAEPPGLIVPAVLGNPNAMRVGDEAFVVGHPLGLTGSMSSGVISGFDRSIRPPESEHRLEGLIQIDAAVNPGNSGGPLLNRRGQVIGIITALANPTEQDFFIGIGFAVPITIAGGAAGAPPY